MAEFEITDGLIPSAKKIVVYGPEGIGKSTFAAGFPGVLFIDTEGSTKELPVRRLQKPTSWEMLLDEIDYVIGNPTVCDTLAIDTIDWAEQLCVDAVCAANGRKGIEDFGYGKGYVYEKEAFARLLHRLEDLVDAGVNVILTAHAAMRKVEQPEEMGGYDHWELKLGSKTTGAIAPLVKEWADLLLFANYKTLVVSTDDKGKRYKAQGGRRVMYTTHTPWWDAKNRCNLPEEMDFSHGPIVELLIPRDTLADPDAAMMEAGRQKIEAQRREARTNAAAAEAAVQKQGDPSQAEKIRRMNLILDEAGVPPVPVPTEPVQSEPVPPEPVPPEPVPTEPVPRALADLMVADGVTAADLRRAVAAMGYYPEDTPISAYDPEFVSGAIIGHWSELKAYLREI